MKFWDYAKVFVRKPKQAFIPVKFNRKKLDEFWRIFNKYTDKEAKLSLLRHFSDLKHEEVQVNKRDLIKKRSKYDRKKNREFRFDGSLCKVCGSGESIERHHVLALKNGGHNHLNNLIPLCKFCHSEVHPWLKEIIKAKLREVA